MPAPASAIGRIVPPLLTGTTNRGADSPVHYSHSIILSNGNAVISQCKFFLLTTKNRLADPSEICALESKREFGRFAIRSVSATIGIDRSIFEIRSDETSLARP
jgi:hypothetical protein